MPNEGGFAGPPQKSLRGFCADPGPAPTRTTSVVSLCSLGFGYGLVICDRPAGIPGAVDLGVYRRSVAAPGMTSVMISNFRNARVSALYFSVPRSMAAVATAE